MSETFGGVYSFLASQAIWQFDYAWNTLVPALVDPRFIARNRVMTTDNDDKLCGPLVASPKFANGRHRQCTFHGITQIWPKNNITSLRIRKGHDVMGSVVSEAIKRITLSWTNCVESEEELNVSHKCLKELLGMGEHMQHFDDCFADDVAETIETKIWRCRCKLAHFVFMAIRSFGTRTSNTSEIEGGVLRHHKAGPKPNQSMAKSADAACKVSDMGITLKEQGAAKAMGSVPTKLDDELRPLCDEVTPFASNKIAENYKRRQSKAVFRVSETEFWVKQKSFPAPSPGPKNADDFAAHLTVLFQRTRVAKIVDVNGVLCLA